MCGLPYFAVYNVQFFAHIFERKERYALYVGSTDSVSAFYDT